MTTQETIKVLNAHNNFVFVTTDKLHEAINIAIKVLEKQIPVKPRENYFTGELNLKDGNYEYCCPICDCGLAGTENFCHDCGQKLDWEVE